MDRELSGATKRESFAENTQETGTKIRNTDVVRFSTKTLTDMTATG